MQRKLIKHADIHICLYIRYKVNSNEQSLCAIDRRLAASPQELFSLSAIMSKCFMIQLFCA